MPESARERTSPVSFEDHFTQARLFWSSLAPVEKEHTIRAYTFELGKCYERAIKERQLQALANIDPVLCEQVANGLGLPVPEATQPLADVSPSLALSQLGRTWPVDGRLVGIVVDPAGAADGVREARQRILAGGMVPLLVGPDGGMLDDDLPLQRSFLTAKSVEFDALLLAGSPAPAPDALVSRDAKADEASAAALHVDPRVVLMVAEAFRHAKAIGG